jgi:hypothetical protein
LTGSLVSTPSSIPGSIKSNQRIPIFNRQATFTANCTIPFIYFQLIPDKSIRAIACQDWPLAIIHILQDRPIPVHFLAHDTLSIPSRRDTHLTKANSSQYAKNAPPP